MNSGTHCSIGGRDQETVMNKLVPLHERPVLRPTNVREPKLNPTDGLGCFYLNDWLAMMVGCWSNVAINRQAGCCFGGRWLKTMKMVKVVKTNQNWLGTFLLSESSANFLGAIQKMSRSFFARLCFFFIRSQTLVLGGRGVGRLMET